MSGKTNGQGPGRWELWEPGSLSMSQTEDLASFAQAFRTQLINVLVNAKAIYFTVSIKTNVEQIMCLTGECQTLRPELCQLGSTVAPWC